MKYYSACLLTTFLISSVTSVVCPAQVPDGFQQTWNPLAEDFRTELQQQGVVGGSLWLMSDGEVVRKEMVGYSDIKSGQRVDEWTIYHWASITKTFTAIALMQLRDQGLLDLDDPIVDYLPSLDQVHNSFGPMRDITLRMLLSHSAGFRNSSWPWGGGEDWHPHEPTEWSQLVAMMPYTEILFMPDSQYSYSNPGIIFLGEVIEQLTGDDIEVYIAKNIFMPLGMTESYFDTTPRHLLDHRSNNYEIDHRERRANGKDFDTGITTANGGLNAPFTDMTRYLAFLTGHCETDSCRGVLSRESLREMWTPRIGMDAESAIVTAEDPDTGRYGIGLSFFTADLPGGVHIVGHTGSQKAFRSFFVFDPEADVAVIGVTNTMGDPTPDADALRTRFKARIVHDVFPLFR